MACSITLPFWPTATDCISWSKDNQIAVVGGESIAILTPRLKEPGPDGKNWDTTVFPVNAFTQSEIPSRDLLSNVNFSIGEEVSQWAAVRAVWSSPGLAPHKGCALAILTSNHVLSLWAAYGKPNINSNWRRHLIVNHAVRTHYSDVAPSSEEDPRLRAESLRVSQRIHAFAWSHPLHATRPNEDPELKNFLDWGHQFLAVSTGCGDILIFRAQTPHSDGAARWGITLTEVISLRRHVPTVVSKSYGKSTASPDKRAEGTDIDLIADGVVWSDWSWDESVGEVATLAFVVNGKLFTTKLHGNMESGMAEVRCRQPFVIDPLLPDCSDVSPGPLAIQSHGQTQSIIAVGSGLMFQVPIDRERDMTSHHLDDRWDDVTGIAVCRHAHEKHTLHIVSLLSSGKAPTAEVVLPFRPGNKGSPSWQHSINLLRDLYNSELDLEDNVMERTYGIHASPFSNYVAVCTSMHPSDSLGYVISSEQISTLNISLEITPLQDKPVSAQRVAGKTIPIPAESLIFEEKRRIENAIRFASVEAPDQQSLTDQILNILPRNHDSGQQPTLPNNGLYRAESLIRLVKTRINFDPELQGYRAALLAGFILDRPVRRDHVMRTAVQKLVAAILALPTAGLHMDHASLQMFQIYKQVLSIHETGRANVDLNAEWQETCRVCSSHIPLVSVKWASCVKGHNFSRCAMSFLSISGPGTTKRCGICRAVFLNEQTLASYKAGSENGVQSVNSDGNGISRPKQSQMPIADDSNATNKPSLVDVLFAACDVCIYCGGRFVDK